MVKKLQEIESFGEIAADEDALLDQCFEDHESYRAVRDFRRWLVVGRKGAGKTAIFKKILNESGPTIFSLGHTFGNYPWHHHDQQKKNGVPERECFMHSWTYLILITLAKILINDDHSQPHDTYSLEALSSIEVFLKDTYGTANPDVSKVFQPAAKLKLKANLGLNLQFISAGISSETIEMRNLPVLVQEVNNNISEKIMRSMNPKMQYFIAFDELDLNFSLSEDNYRLRLIGLISAARQINNLARSHNKQLNVIIFLREDIYQFLKFEDKNKITDSAVTLIEWDTSNTHHTLKELMSKRINFLLDCEEPGGWDIAFDETKSMRGHQSKYQHILDRTMFRPRDIIKFCNVILSTFKKDPDLERHKFNNSDVNGSRHEYSSYLLSELDDEVFRHIPNHEKYYELLRDLDAVVFEMSEFEEICEKRRGLFEEPKTASDILAELFEFSIVGYYQPGGAGYGGAEYVFRFKAPRASFNSRANSFQVHLGLQEALALKRYRRTTSPVNSSDGG